MDLCRRTPRITQVCLAILLVPYVVGQTVFIDRRVTVQPIIIRSDDGSVGANPPLSFYEAETDKIYAQAGIDFEFLSPYYYNKTLFLNISSTAGDPNSLGALATTSDSPKASDPTVINLWLTSTIKNSSSAYGYSFQSTKRLADGRLFEKNGVSIAQSAFNYSSSGGIGMRDIFAYEVSRNLGLNNESSDPDNLFGALSDPKNLMKLSGPYPTSADDIYPDGSGWGHLTPDQISRVREASYAVSLGPSSFFYTYTPVPEPTLGVLACSVVLLLVALTRKSRC